MKNKKYHAVWTKWKTKILHCRKTKTKWKTKKYYTVGTNEKKIPFCLNIKKRKKTTLSKKMNNKVFFILFRQCSIFFFILFLQNSIFCFCCSFCSDNVVFLFLILFQQHSIFCQNKKYYTVGTKWKTKKYYTVGTKWKTKNTTLSEQNEKQKILHCRNKMKNKNTTLVWYFFFSFCSDSVVFFVFHFVPTV
jgi:hypothetical protein